MTLSVRLSDGDATVDDVHHVYLICHTAFRPKGDWPQDQIWVWAASTWGRNNGNRQGSGRQINRFHPHSNRVTNRQHPARAGRLSSTECWIRGPSVGTPFRFGQVVQSNPAFHQKWLHRNRNRSCGYPATEASSSRHELLRRSCRMRIPAESVPRPQHCLRFPNSDRQDLPRIDLGAPLVGSHLPTQSAKLLGDVFSVSVRSRKASNARCREIGIPSDRAREMHVVTTGQGIVPHHRWGVRGLGQRTKNGIGNRARLRLVFHRVKKTLQVVPCRFFRNVHPGVSSRNTKLLHITPTWIRVRPAQDGHFELGEQSTDRFVGLHHEHFNQRVGEGVVSGTASTTRPSSANTRSTSGRSK